MTPARVYAFLTWGPIGALVAWIGKDDKFICGLLIAYLIVLYSLIVIPWPHRRWGQAEPGTQRLNAEHFKKVIMLCHYTVRGAAAAVCLMLLGSFFAYRELPAYIQTEIMTAVREKSTTDDLQKLRISIQEPAPPAEGLAGKNYVTVPRVEATEAYETAPLLKKISKLIFDPFWRLLVGVAFLYLLLMGVLYLIETMGDASYKFICIDSPPVPAGGK